MSALPQLIPDGANASSASARVQDIMVEYDETNEAVSVTPDAVKKGTSVRFKCSKGSLKIVFLSPTGKETETLTDSDVCKLTIGGAYHFKCYFTLPNGTESPENGGVLDVLPHRP